MQEKICQKENILLRYYEIANEKAAPKLSEKFHVYSIDCYGHGGSLHDAAETDFVLYYFENQRAWGFFPDKSRERVRAKLTNMAAKYRKKYPDKNLKVPFCPKAETHIDENGILMAALHIEKEKEFVRCLPEL